MLNIATSDRLPDSVQSTAAPKMNQPICNSLCHIDAHQHLGNQDVKARKAARDSLHPHQKAQENFEGFFDFKRGKNKLYYYSRFISDKAADYIPEGQKLWIQAIDIVERAMNASGDRESLLKEAYTKFTQTEHSSTEYRLYGAVINEIRISLKERLEKRMAEVVDLIIW